MLKAQKELDTEYKRRCYNIRDNFNYVAPNEIVVNKEEVKLGKPKDNFHWIPVSQTFKCLLEKLGSGGDSSSFS